MNYPTTLEECKLQYVLGVIPRNLFICANANTNTTWLYYLLIVYGNKTAAKAFANTLPKNSVVYKPCCSFDEFKSLIVCEFIIVTNEDNGFTLLQGPE
jgi:hypothetical protein